MRPASDLPAYRDEIAAVLVRDHGYPLRKAAGIAETICVMSMGNGSSPEQAASIWVMDHTRATPKPAKPARHIDAHDDNRRRLLDDRSIATVDKALDRVNKSKK
ncbi:MAG TPA: hypothetical protein VJO99_16245 [Burkholderiaceae bacterium]|nr:hypothetical protein [Burkholderiaceae bacterium]